MKTSSCKNKGRSLQKLVAAKILDAFKSLTPDDVCSRPMGSSGCDIMLSKAALDLFPFDLECKNVQKLNIWDAFEQVEKRCPQTKIPAVVFKRNRSNVYIALPLDDFMDIMKTVR